MLTDRHDAYALLARLGATPRLLTHLRLVGEAADGRRDVFERLDSAFEEIASGGDDRLARSRVG